MRIVGENNEQIGVISTYEALKMAREAGLDLVEVAPNVRPPVCRIMDYGKWKYQQKKNVKRSTEQQLKEVRLRPKTDTHDREIKLRQAIRFLAEGDKVQFTMQFRGREQAHREIGYDTFRGILAELGQRVKIERAPSIDGRNMIMIVSPVKGAFDGVVPKPQAEAKAAPQPSGGEARKAAEPSRSEDAQTPAESPAASA